MQINIENGKPLIDEDKENHQDGVCIAKVLGILIIGFFSLRFRCRTIY